MESEALAALPDRAQRPGHTEDRAEPVELAALRAALGQLSEADQMIIHLRHHGGLSFKQIAEILDQPLGTVLAKQHRALKKLAEILERTIGKPHPDD
jgi:RNA polymerase sigma factor (sigma-70 family)